MGLNLLLGRRRREGKAVILADPAGGSIEPAVAGLISQLGAIQPVVPLLLLVPCERFRSGCERSFSSRSRSRSIDFGLRQTTVHATGVPA